MNLFISLQAILLQVLLLLHLLHPGDPFTVIMPDSGSPPALVDGPQNGFTMNNNLARTDVHEQDAVYDIMRATGNDWATNIPDICRGRWHGIECMPDKDNVFHVVGLSFGALSDDTAFPTCDPTRSFISPSVTKLPHIRTLFFYRCFNNNPQPIPTFLGRLGSTLQTLVLRENGHFGPIPNELGNLTRLRVLDLHKNNLAGPIPVSLGRISGLRSLVLSGNKLTGSIPNLSFPALNVLDLNQNRLVGSIPDALSSCHSLIKLDLSRNHLSGQIPESIDGLESLILMDLSYNTLSGTLPASLKTMNFLQALILSGNQIAPSTISGEAFDGLKDLTILILSDMNLEGPIPETLGRLPKLRVLHLDRNKLNGSIPKSFSELNNLSELRLNDNKLSGSIPFKREMVWKMRKKLKLSNNSGLCYDSKSGLGEDLDALFDSGIGPCGDSDPGSSKSVQHISTKGGEEVHRESVKSAAAAGESSFLNTMLGLISLLSFAVYVW